MDDPKQVICEAAIRLAAREGIGALTVDRVAKEAGFSKSGVLHHFESKDKLLLGVVTFFGRSIEGRLTQLVADDPNPRLKWIRSLLVLTMLPDQAKSKDQAQGEVCDSAIVNQFMTSLMAASVGNRELIDPIREIGFTLKKRLLSNPDDGFDQVLLWLAIDGLFLWQIVGMIDESEGLYQDIVKEIARRCHCPIGESRNVKKTPRVKAESSRAENSKVKALKRPRKKT